MLKDELVKHAMELGPRALVGLMVPLAQFIWKRWNDRSNLEDQKKALREKSLSLAAFLKSADALGTSPEAEKSRQDAERELQETLRALASLSLPRVASPGPSPQAAPPPPFGRSRIRSWFLFYTPSGLAWLPHVLFFMTVALIFFGVIGVASDPQIDWDAVFGLGLFAGIAIAIRGWARSYEKPSGPAGPLSGSHPGKVRRALLLYVPWRPAGWVPHILFYLAGICGLAIAGAGFTNGADEFEPGAIRQNLDWVIPGLAVFGLVLISARGWARSYVPPAHAASEGLSSPEGVPLNERSRIRRWLLLYSPSSRAAWVFHALFFVCLLILMLATPEIITEAGTDPDALYGFIGIGVWLVLLLSVRALAVHFDRARSQPRPVQQPPDVQSDPSAL